MNYYNEFDPKAAMWLRELIYAGAIPEGEVDERSIEDVSVADLGGFTQHHFFAGIGGWSLALSLAGWPEDLPVWTGSCPCQPFSNAGKRNGTADERHLWPAWQWLIKQYRPHRVFGEQVASKDGIAWLDTVSTDLEGEGYAVAPIVLPACSVGAFHKRERLWFVADTDGRNAGAAREQRSGQHGQLAQNRSTSQLDDSDHRRSPEQEPGSSARGSSGTHQLAEPKTLGRAPWRSSEAREGTLESDRSRSTNSMGNTCGARTGRHTGAISEAEREARLRSIDHSALASSANVADADRARSLSCPLPGVYQVQKSSGSRNVELERSRATCNSVADTSSDRWVQRWSQPNWRSAQWHRCKDGKHRAIEPGIQPLAHGVSGRVGLLRGYGNAIVPQVAAEIISTYMELRGV